LDKPQAQQRAIVLPADPLPIIQARPEKYAVYETDQRVTSAPPIIDPVTGIPMPQGDVLVTETGDTRVTQEVGRPNGEQLAAAQTQYQKVQYGPTLAAITAIGDGNYTVTVNCSKAHGLTTASTIIASGLLAKAADGTYTVTSVPSATVFTYTTQSTIPASTLWSTSSAIWTANVGFPYGMTQAPQTGN